MKLFKVTFSIIFLGKSPEIMFLDKNGEMVERQDISRLTRDELNELMESKGFAKKTLHDEN